MKPILREAKAEYAKLQFLSANEWILITDKASQVTFKKDERLVGRGGQLQTLYLLGGEQRFCDRGAAFRAKSGNKKE